MSLLEKHYADMVAERRMSYVKDSETMSHLSKIARWLYDDSMKTSLLLSGFPGNGKTTMTHAIMRTFASVKESISNYKAIARQSYLQSIEHLKEEAYWAYVGAYDNKPKEVLDAEEALKRIPEDMKITSAQYLSTLANEKDELEKIKKHPFLIIDDFGCEPTEVKVYGTAVTPVVDILYYRYDNLLPTVITTNLGKSKIKETYGMRVADRIEEMCESIAFTNNSYRQ